MNNFRRVLLKLSGESLMGAKQYGIDNDRLADYVQDIEAAVKRGIQVAIVIGGGNIFRGLSGAAQRLRSCARRPNGYAGHRHQ